MEPKIKKKNTYRYSLTVLLYLTLPKSTELKSPIIRLKKMIIKKNKKEKINQIKMNRRKDFCPSRYYLLDTS